MSELSLDNADLVIFDWDGTLVDSKGAIVGAIRGSLNDVGLPVWPDEELQQVIGLGLAEAIRELLPDQGPEVHESVAEAYRERFLTVTSADMPLFEGVREGLEELLRQGRRLAVATGKSRRGLDRVLDEMGLGELFRATRCADETCSKPDPLMVHELLAEIGVDPARAVLVGDTEFDMAMARDAGVGRIAATYGVHGPQRLARAEPHAWARDFSEVMDLLVGPADHGNNDKAG
jgi:phosphoglycolate phosphatase